VQLLGMVLVVLVPHWVIVGLVLVGPALYSLVSLIPSFGWA
jgi:hypothetical protein